MSELRGHAEEGRYALYTRTEEAKYQTMIDDALGFYRNGFEDLYLKYSPPPSGDGSWHRTGLPEDLIYDDDFSYGLWGLYGYESWSSSVKKVYEFINSIGASSEYPNYNPAICWAGYVDVVNRKPACEYYDAVTAGILYEIRNVHDPLALEQSANTIFSNSEAFMYWGVKFSDFSPIETKKSIVTVSWLAQLLLNYSPLASVFTRIILIEPGYASNDYIRIYVVSFIAHRDKMVCRGIEYEVGPVEEFRFRDQLMYRTAICRRLIK